MAGVSGRRESGGERAESATFQGCTGVLADNNVCVVLRVRVQLGTGNSNRVGIADDADALCQKSAKQTGTEHMDMPNS